MFCYGMNTSTIRIILPFAWHGQWLVGEMK
jgi:hypothetical protein